MPGLLVRRYMEHPDFLVVFLSRLKQRDIFTVIPPLLRSRSVQFIVRRSLWNGLSYPWHWGHGEINHRKKNASGCLKWCQRSKTLSLYHRCLAVCIVLHRHEFAMSFVCTGRRTDKFLKQNCLMKECHWSNGLLWERPNKMNRHGL